MGSSKCGWYAKLLGAQSVGSDVGAMAKCDAKVWGNARRRDSIKYKDPTFWRLGINNNELECISVRHTASCIAHLYLIDMNYSSI